MGSVGDGGVGVATQHQMAHSEVGAGSGVYGLRCGVKGLHRVYDGREHLVFDTDGFQGITGGFTRFSHHYGDGLADVGSLVSG